jgi:2-polyprenyl-3-methyl-5-hydroxy-6-metoxy-1,4-benzoquinol methylase
VTWTHAHLEFFLSRVPLSISTALDVGCGRGIIGSLLRIYREPSRVVGLDMFDPYIDFCKKLGVYTELIKQDLRKPPLPFRDNEFDLSVAFEVIEHLRKEDGASLLRELERVSRTVIISTPNHYFHQSEYEGNPYQEHLSRWTTSDLKKRGYSVFGVGGLLLFGHEIKHISYVLGRITIPLPYISGTIMGVYSK